LGDMRTSVRNLRMANGSIVPSTGCWIGDMVWGLVQVRGWFEVFPSGGAWTFLLGKPMLEIFCTVHDY
ncbi:hypothetical protein C8Q75DRAFT_696317, partial [Abortiporus biennis]